MGVIRPSGASLRLLRPLGKHVSAVGLGTGSLPPTNEAAVVRRNAEVVRRALLGGVTLIDCASNYADGVNEVIVGRVLSGLFASGSAERDRVVVCSKGGYVLGSNDHRLDPRFLDEQLDASLDRLELDFVDLYFLHNPEEALLCHGPANFSQIILRAFDLLESAVADGRIRGYGVASADGFRIPGPGFHPIADLLSLAESAGGSSHHFTAIQLPFSLAHPEALVLANQRLSSRMVPALVAARACGLVTIGSASLNRMHLPLGALKAVSELTPALKRPAQVALSFARSAPGLDCALFGTSNPDHVSDALEVLDQPPIDLNGF